MTLYNIPTHIYIYLVALGVKHFGILYAVLIASFTCPNVWLCCVMCVSVLLACPSRVRYNKTPSTRPGLCRTDIRILTCVALNYLLHIYCTIQKQDTKKNMKTLPNKLQETKKEPANETL